MVSKNGRDYMVAFGLLATDLQAEPLSQLGFIK